MSNKPDQQISWESRVNHIFGGDPKVRRLHEDIWISRPKKENDIEQQIAKSGIHVCVDGPSGSGKTSLALSTFDRLEAEYIEV